MDTLTYRLIRVACAMMTMCYAAGCAETLREVQTQNKLILDSVVRTKRD